MKKRYFLLTVIICMFFAACSDWIEVPTQLKNTTEEVAESHVWNIPANTSCLFLSPYYANLWVAGTEDGTVYFSYDKGNKWEQKGNVGAKINCFCEYKYSAYNISSVLIGSDIGIFELPVDGNKCKKIFPDDSQGSSPAKINFVTYSMQGIAVQGTQNKNYYSSATFYGSDKTYNTFSIGIDSTGYRCYRSNLEPKLKLSTLVDSTSYELVAMEQDKSGRIYVFNSLTEEKSMIAYAYSKPYYNIDFINISQINSKVNQLYEYYGTTDYVLLATNKGIYQVTNPNGSTMMYSQQGKSVQSIIKLSSRLLAVSGNSIYICNNNETNKSFVVGDETDCKLSKMFHHQYDKYIYSSTGKLFQFNQTLLDNNSFLGPNILSPERSNQLPDVITLKWLGTKQYADRKNKFHLQISTSPNFETILIDVKNLEGFSYQATGLEKYKTHYWRIREKNESNISAWSSSSFMRL